VLLVFLSVMVLLIAFLSSVFNDTSNYAFAPQR
jgi:hypothetical protein